ncbi:MAG: 30S ribosomal protein S5 [Candidatus Falkowbacteria bacterium]|nr:30S ribosomal protein S5 [Candidatus Falkowbacteria bacterium]
MEDKKITTEAKAKDAGQGAAATVAKDLYGEKKRGGGGFQGGRGKGRGDRRDDRSKDEMEQRILEVARVTRVMAGGKRMNFRACVAIGDRKGSVGVGVGKGADVTMAVNKAVNRAKKEMVKVPTVKDTIPHAITKKMGAALVMLKPAKTGRGVIAGGVTRVILELAGIKNITSKALGSNNKINNARCTIAALRELRTAEPKAVKAEEKNPASEIIKKSSEDQRLEADK